MALTPFPYALNAGALEYTYAHVASDADMMAAHLGGYGVPWPEASADAFPYNANVMGQWESIRSNTKPGQRVYLALSPINGARNGLADLWDATGINRPLPSPWNGVAFNDPRVKAAYLNYCRRAIAFFNPAYLTIGIEVNQVMAANPSAWAAYVDLHRTMYSSLKASYPAMPIMVSMTANELLGYVDANVANQDRARADIADTSDYFCLSMYLYMGANAGGSFPADTFTRLAAMTSKPTAICETGYPSQSFTLRRGGAATRSDPTAQKTFIDRLLQAADQYSYRFIVHFFVRDLDESLDVSDLTRIFRYDGLYDVNGGEKPALASWKQKLGTSVRTSAVATMTPDSIASAPAKSGEEGGEPAAEMAPPDAPTFVFANNNQNGMNTVSAFAMGSDGTLTTVAGSPAPTGGSGSGLWRGVVDDIVAAPQGWLFAANHGGGTISAFAIDRVTGALAALPGSPFAVSGWPAGDIALALDPSGHLLVAANAATGTIVALSVGADGSLTPRGAPLATGGRPAAVRVTPDGRFVAATLDGDGRIAVFRLAGTGPIALVDGSPFFGRFVNTTSVDFACSGDTMYAANAAIGARRASGIELFHVAPNGALTPATALAFPASQDWSRGVVRVSPDDRHVFLSDDGTRGGTISVLDPAAGSLWLVRGSPFAVGTGAALGGMALSSTGRFLVTANHASHAADVSSIHVLAIAGDGRLALAPGSPHAVPGSSLGGVAIFPPAQCAPTR
jgi:DNA-binding beta-propeller fold protein YncE